MPNPHPPAPAETGGTGGPTSARGRWRALGSLCLDLLYPPVCSGCHISTTRGRSLCSACDQGIPHLAPPFCERCGEHFEGQIESSFTCPNCSDLKLAFQFARPGLPRDPLALEMIHRLKYSRDVHLAPELARLAYRAFQDPRLETALAEKWPLVPVPLHRGRLHSRHFNQAEEIGRCLSRLTGLPVVKALRRIRRTETQTALNRAKRLENLRRAFALSRAGKKCLASAPAGLILIDDVLTTGSTADACAKALRKAGFPQVAVVVVMRG